MNEEIMQVAIRIKALREIANLSTEEIAKELNIAKEEYENYENGENDIPVSFLYSLASRYKVELTEILTGESPRLKVYELVKKGEGIGVDRRKDYKYQSLAYNFTHKRMEPFIVIIEPKDVNIPIHYNSHKGQEFNYLLEGRIAFYINGKEIILNEGDSIYFDSGYGHTHRALDNKNAKFLAIILN